MSVVNYNERSWAIDLITEINIWLSKRNIVIKRAGGENTLKLGAKSLFPDVLLFGDLDKGRILQGWELKMPDTSLNDTEFIENAKIKAKLLSLNSFLLWNVSCAILYKIENDDSLTVVKNWNNLSHLNTREEVPQYKAEINAMLAEILNDLNAYILQGEISTTSVVDALSTKAVSTIIQNNLSACVQCLKDATLKDIKFSNEVTLWWRYAKYDYPEEKDKYVVLTRNNLLFLINKFIFAHILKSYQGDASIIDTIEHDTDLKSAIETFKNISEKCDFWNVFQNQKGEEFITPEAWKDILSFNDLLKDFKFTQIDKNILHDLLGLTIYKNKRKFAGQFTTPLELAKLAVRLTIEDKSLHAIDPCCGTGTIAKEIYKFKREQFDVSKSLETLWASDKFSLPLQMAMFNLAEPEALGNVVKIFKEDATKLTVGQTIKFHEPFKGTEINISLPNFDYIVSNLPFVQQEDVALLNADVFEINEVIKEKVGKSLCLDGHSDLYAYLPFYFWNLLTENGKISIIVSNAWLGTAWGEKFFNALSSFFEIENITTSGKGRWFKNAKVVSNIITLRKKANPSASQADSIIRFTILKKDVKDYDDEDLQEAVALTSSVSSVDETDLSVQVYTSEKINRIRALGLNLNSFFTNNEWLLELSEKLVKVSTIFDIGRGERRGWDNLFFPPSEVGIEQEYLRPVLKTPKSVKNLVAKPDGVAFCCDKTKEELKALGHIGALAWINKFEGQANESGIPLPKALARKNMYWYSMLPATLAEMTTSINFGDRLFFARFETPTFVNQRLVRFTAKSNSADSELCHALMNSLITLFYIEAMGTGRGEGALDLSKNKIESDLRMINPDLITDEKRQKILFLFKKIKSRSILTIEQELLQQDRIDFDNEVLDAIGCLLYKKQIEESLLNLYRIRTAVNS